MDKIYKYKVTTRCMTYNHAFAIEDTLRGFSIQETTFPVSFVIVDDASTDGEQGILEKWVNGNLVSDGEALWHNKSYGHLAVGKLKDHANSNFVVLLLNENLTQKGLKIKKLEYISEWNENAEYLALCEGDDYWIDPRKLQKQVDFMDKHPGHSLCFCSHKNLYPSGETLIISRYDAEMEECPMEDIILGGGTYMATNSMLYRCSMYQQRYSTWAIGCPIGDVPLMLTLANNGKVAFLYDVMCVYRITANGSWTSKMGKSFKLRWKHNRTITRMWYQFDKWSDRKYHKMVSQRIWHNKKEIFKDAVLTFIRKIK